MSEQFKNIFYMGQFFKFLIFYVGKLSKRESKQKKKSLSFWMHLDIAIWISDIFC